MAEWPDDQMTRWPNDQRSRWQNDRITWWPDGLMNGWPDDQMTRWTDEQMTGWPDDMMTGSFPDDWPYCIFLNTTLQNSTGNCQAIVLIVLPPKWVFHTIYTFFAPQNMLFSKKENNTKYNIVLLWVTQPQAALPLILLFVVCVSDGGLDFLNIFY